jgi:hypothetical protein
VVSSPVIVGLRDRRPAEEQTWEIGASSSC